MLRYKHEKVLWELFRLRGSRSALLAQEKHHYYSDNYRFLRIYNRVGSRLGALYISFH